MKNLLLIGGGSFSLEVSNYLNDYFNFIKKDFNVIGVVDKNKKNKSAIQKIRKKKIIYYAKVPILKDKFEGIITIGDPKIREKCRLELKYLGIKLFKIIHPASYLANTAKVNDGSIICPMCYVGPFSNISSNVIVNVFSNIGHESRIGKSAVLSPHSSIHGKAKCGNMSFLGSHSSIMPGSVLGNFSKLSAGSKLYGKFKDNLMVSGNPADIIMKYKK